MNTSRRRPSIGITESQLEAKFKKLIKKHKFCPVHGNCKVHTTFPKPNYNSGWVSVAKGETKRLEHNLGGDVNNYLVDMQFYNTITSSIHNQHIGGDWDSRYVKSGDSTKFEVLTSGVYWGNLNRRSIKLFREDGDGYAKQIRIRIWVYD